jgi:hypothetical protein
MAPAAPVPHVTRRARHRRPWSFLERLVERLVSAIVAPVAIVGGLGAALAAFALSRSSMAVGVVVETTATPGNSETTPTPGATFFVAGLTERGDVDGPVLVRSMAEYAEKLGGRVAYGNLYDALAAYFGEGGVRAYVARLTGDAATTGTLMLVDRAGAPLDTLRLDAASPGAWSSGVTVQVADGIVDDTFTITVRVGGQVVETFADLASPAAAAAVINGRSAYLVATDQGSATAEPNNNPAVLAATALSAGDDDRGSLVAADYVTALERFPASLGAGAIAIPGHAASAVGAGLIAHANDRRRMALMAPAQGADVAAASAEAAALRATTGSQHAGMFYPWVTVPDGSGSTRTVSPEGYVAGVRARAHRQVGPWRAAAGEIAAARYVVAPAQELTTTEVNTLNDSRVNPIRVIAGSTRVYGWRSLSIDTVNYLHLTASDMLNVIAAEAQVALEQFVFRSVDAKGHLFAELEGEVIGILEPIRSAGGLYERLDDDGNPIDPGYSVDTGPTVNTVATLALGEVNIAVAIRVSPVGELIRLNITKVAIAAAV